MDDESQEEAVDVSEAVADEPDASADDGVEAQAPAEPEAEAPAEPEAEAPPEPEAEAPAEPEAEASAEADSAGDDEEQEIAPEVQEFLGQDTTTVVHTKADKDEHGVPTTFRTPPGIPGGLDPGSLADKDLPPRPTS